ncbi:hypothetical protein T4C_9297 [Trichinella pseudospiralis]|uniref:Uncharacterized protein n=1 Tax=Trichinella pseudospiralis TaxID=6337 RepID=A0A0V1GPX9_TRIPS|nr:hypothetical protein T4C_9297 [Trichinella pseudospiralis]
MKEDFLSESSFLPQDCFKITALRCIAEHRRNFSNLKE